MADRNPKILVVDDDPFMTEILSFVLQSSGYDVETAANGVEAFEKCLFDPEIGLIVSDLNMPEMGGLELIGRLREGGASIPVIILTGSDEGSEVEEALKLGANRCLKKDENLQEVIVGVVEEEAAASR